MNNKKFILQEEIKRMRELSTYDKSKTLNEQGSADINMDRVNQQQLAQAPESTVDGNAWMEEFYPKVNNSYKYLKTTFLGKPALKYDYNPNSTTIYTQNRWYQYPKGITKGEPTIKGSWKLNGNEIVAVKDAAYNKPAVQKPAQAAQPAKPPLKTAGQSTPNTKESSIGITYQYDYPKDKNYTYGVKDKKWFGKKLDNGKEFDLSTFTTTIANLNRQFPNALTQQEPSAPAAPAPAAPALAAAPAAAPTATTPITPKKLTDMVKIELDNMKKNQPLAFNSAYNKLGAIEKAQVDKTYANK